MKKVFKSLVVLMGLPSSGKSTIARLLATELTRQTSTTTTVIGTDDIRQKIHHFDPDFEPFIKDETLVNIQSSFQDNIIVINDDMNYYKSMRHELKQIAEDNHAHFILIHVAVPLKMALEWNKKRGLSIPQEVIKRVHKKFDPPGVYKWDTPLLTIHSEDTSPASAVAQIIAKLLPKITSPLPPPPIAPTTAPNLAEKIDILTRKIVSTIAQDEKNPEILKKISKFRLTYLKTLQNMDKSLEKLEEEFTHALNQYLSQLRQAT
ncbi:MAG: AAA family ATPase [Candidatus Helarchaeota archaeon]